uniref:Sec-independent protein translocase-like protein n=1 Tax=Astrosyne radiata TaxID=1158023 RepID=A0A2U9NT52_9STRA|nr:sec-independent protein translocase-like protein [Astrosyne radiata]AWT40304.1 sec-independent protein translocase-like protein [Astrosyne radiata]
MKMNSNFRFSKSHNTEFELPFSEHIEELRQRCLFFLLIALFFISFSFFEIKSIVKILEPPIDNLKFFQLSPGEYLFSTIKISFYTGFLFTIPFGIGQFIFFLLPGLTKKETNLLLPLLTSSIILFSSGLLFSYYILIPAALNFFLSYSEEVIEPLWSFDQYFEFILVLFYSTGFAFQIPIIQIIIGLLNILSVTQMAKAWRVIVVLATVIGAILTPSTDPITQLLLSLAIIMLYFMGLIILRLMKNYTIT